MKMLDLFCGGGGAARGYADLGIEVVGVDHRNQPKFPYEFIKRDALEVLADREFLQQFTAIHASPPCQMFSQTRHMGHHNQAGKVDLLTPTLQFVNDDHLWIVENVERAPLDPAVMLCGSMFGLTGFDPRRQLRRHRKFLTNFPVPQPKCKHNCFRPLGVYGILRDDIPGGGQTASSLAEASKLMGIDWMRWTELREAIPPAYTQYVGKYLLEAESSCTSKPVSSRSPSLRKSSGFTTATPF